jgi:hypothetical protein
MNQENKVFLNAKQFTPFQFNGIQENEVLIQRFHVTICTCDTY